MNFLNRLLAVDGLVGNFKLPALIFDLLFFESSTILFKGDTLGTYNDSDLLKYGIGSRLVCTEFCRAGPLVIVPRLKQQNKHKL